MSLFGKNNSLLNSEHRNILNRLGITLDGNLTIDGVKVTGVNSDPPPATDTTPPNEVTSLAYSNVAETSATISWVASTSTDISGYEVYQGNTLLATTSGVSYNATNLTSNTLYEFTVKAKDNSENVSTGVSISFTTLNSSAATTEGMIFDVDFTNMAVSNANTIYDTVNNYPVTLTGLTHDGVNDGFLDNTGVRFQTSDYASIPFNTGQLKTDISSADSFTIEYRLYNPKGIIGRADSNSFRVYYTGTDITRFVPYINTALAKTSAGGGGGTLTHLDTSETREPSQAFNTTGDLNIVTLRMNAGGSYDVIINGYYKLTSTISDFSSWDKDLMTLSPHYLRRDLVALNTEVTTYAGASTFNRALTNQEIKDRYDFIKAVSS